MDFEAPAHPARVADLDRVRRAHLRRVLPDDPGAGRRHACGGSSPPSSPAAPWPARSSPSWSRSSPPPTPATCARWSPRRAKAAPSLNIISGLVAGNFSAYWLGLAIMGLMTVAYLVSERRPGRAHAGPGGLRLRPGGLRVPGHGPGHHRRRLLRAGHRQRAVGLRAVADRGDPDRARGREARLRLRAQLRGGQGPAGGERRRRQHLQGHGQARAHRHRGGRAPPP